MDFGYGLWLMGYSYGLWVHTHEFALGRVVVFRHEVDSSEGDGEGVRRELPDTDRQTQPGAG